MMVRLKNWFLIFILLVSGSNFLSAQCLDFASNECMQYFGNFVHDGNNSVSDMKEGDTAELYKTFFSGQTYRLVVCKSNNLPAIHVKVVDSDGKILFDNKDHNYSLIWDFAVKGTQKLVVQIEVLENNTGQEQKASGCVGILFGMEKSK